MVTRVVELKTQIMLSTRFTERFRGKSQTHQWHQPASLGFQRLVGPAKQRTT